ncbi:bifunctional diguanylate cyclase/phosphodiesterase [Petrocella sp. FN5]|uniref:bifunctional diguanylate cyclase/phosphodiesterase n=1 Tax=Petrocella sp. FN5 TaxID=3032002 RepID=UPI0023DB2830|nr:EAL domain-containing protein [Petrocella sp. FN5]MDF1617484.1 EAL domain-containing protein [Petrocella sp. FN5]
MKIRYRLSLYTFLFLGISLFLMSSIFFIYTSSVINHKNENALDQTLQSGVLMINNLLETSRVEATYLGRSSLVTEALKDSLNRPSEASIIDYPEYKTLNDIFYDIRNSDRGIRAAFVIDSRGKVIASGHPESIGLDLEDRDYFIEAMSGNTVTSNLIYDRIDNLASLFVAAPVIYPNGTNTQGVMALIIDTQVASYNLSSLIDPDIGDAYLMDEDGLIIFHSDSSLIGTYHRDISTRNYITNNPALDSGFNNYTHESINYHIAFKRIPSSSWLLVLEQNMDIYMASIYEALWVVLALNLIILSLAAFSYMYYAKIFTRPITELSQIIHQTTTGDLTVRSQYFSEDELGHLSRDFNIMLDELIGAYEEVESKNEELTATEEELRNQNEQLVKHQHELTLSKKRIEELAFTSSLTKLPNRIACDLEIERLLGLLPIPNFSLIHLDIDAFMRINYSLGHTIGDRVLIETAQKLSKLSHSKVNLYHLSADKFAYLLLDCPNELQINEFANAILESFTSPLIINHHEIYLSISLGISVCPHDSTLAEVLKSQAETALYQAKTSGKSQYVFYKKIMTEHVNRRLVVELLLRRAIKDDLVYMVYQPQYTPKAKRLQSYEALMRLKTKSGQSIPPSEFIPIAEEIGLINKLGEWAINEVFSQARTWISDEALLDYICINISGMQIKDPGFVDLIFEATKKYHLAPKFVELEITESIMLDISAATLSVLNQLKDIGFRIALDDFGTGYSSLSYLKTLPIHTLKIDKSFIDDLPHSKRDQDLVRQLIGLSHELNLQVVAEGVEIKSQLDFLQENNCDLIQGYYFSKPLTTEDAYKLMLKSNG